MSPRSLTPAMLAIGALVFALRGANDVKVVPIVFENAAKPAGINFVLKNSAGANK